MQYTYSKPVSAPSYQSPPPSRVSPVSASSFSGPRGGGIFPFIPLPGFTPSSTPEPSSSAGENAAINTAAQNQAISQAMSQAQSAMNIQTGEIRKFNQSAQPQMQPQQSRLKIQASVVNTGTNRLNSQNSQNIRMAKEPTIPNVSTSPNSLDRLLGRDVIVGSEGVDRLYDSIIDRGGDDLIQDRIISGSGKDLIRDRIISGSGTDELRYRSFADVENSLPSNSVSFKVSGQDPVVAPKTQTQPTLKTQGQMSFQNVRDLPVPDTSEFRKTQPAQESMLSRFWNYANQYQQEKMQNPLREIGIQTGASVLAAPILAGLAPAAAVSSAVAPVANNIVRLQPQTAQTTQAVSQAVQNGGNIVRFADYAARNSGTLAAGVAGAMALPAASQVQAWDPETQTYSSGQVRGRR